MSELIPPAHLWFPGMVAMSCLILASGFFSASETALFYLSHDELRSLRMGKPRERAVATLLSDPDRLLTGVLFWNLVINLVYFATSIVIAHNLVEHGHPAAAGFYGVASLFGIILLGEVLPKSAAVVFRRGLASLVSWPLALAVRILDPITPVLGNLTRLARRTFWPHIEREPYLDADDLERAVEASELSDEVIRQERQVLHNILDLSEITVEEVMRPRGTYTMLPKPVHLAHLMGEVPPSDYLVIQDAGTEDIESAVPLTESPTIPDQHLEAAAEEVVHVPWCADVAYTLQLMRERFSSLASVVNEYGETVGIVTYEDIIDTMLMPQPSRAKRLLRREPVLEVAPGRYHVEGITTLRYLCKRLDIEFEPAGDGLVTVAGMLYEELEHIPLVDDECSWRGYAIKVIDVSKRGRLRVMISKFG
jgi:CBS domain containing-hemolysin-like protein